MAASIEEAKKEDTTVASIKSAAGRSDKTSKSGSNASFIKGLVIGLFTVAAVVAWMYLYLNNAHLFSQEEYQSLQQRNSELLEANESLSTVVGSTSSELNALRLQVAERNFADSKQRLDEATALISQIEAAQADFEQAQLDFQTAQARLNALILKPNEEVAAEEVTVEDVITEEIIAEEVVAGEE